MRLCLRGMASPSECLGLVLTLPCLHHPCSWNKSCVCRYWSVEYCGLVVHKLILFGDSLHSYNHVSHTSTVERTLASNEKYTFSALKYKILLCCLFWQSSLLLSILDIGVCCTGHCDGHPSLPVYLTPLGRSYALCSVDSTPSFNARHWLDETNLNPLAPVISCGNSCLS